MKNFFTMRGLVVLTIAVAALMGNVQQTSAQKYTFDPGKTINTEWSGQESIYVDLDILNNTKSELKLSWMVIENNIPMDWMFSLCDNVNCFSSSVIPTEGSDFFPADAGGKVFFKLLFDSSGAFTNVTTIKLGVYETGNKQAGIDTVTFNILPKLSGVHEPSTPFAAVLPNPSTSTVHLSAINAVQTVEVYSAVGVKVMEIANTSAEVTLDIRQLPVGVYFVKSRDIFGKIHTATFHKM